MSKIHVLGRSGPNQYRIMLHVDTPVGNNSAGIPWNTVLVNSGRAMSRMTEGTGAGQITSAELAKVLSGDVIEIAYDFGINPALTNAERNATMDFEIIKLTSETVSELQANLKWFGATRG